MRPHLGVGRQAEARNDSTDPLNMPCAISVADDEFVRPAYFSPDILLVWTCPVVSSLAKTRSHLEHGFESRWGHHQTYISLPREKLGQRRLARELVDELRPPPRTRHWRPIWRPRHRSEDDSIHQDL